MKELKLTPEQAVALLNLLQAEEDWEGSFPDPPGGEGGLEGVAQGGGA